LKILLDTCVSGIAVEELVRRGHNVIWSGSWPEDPGDIEILSIAHKDQRVLVTLDKDFGELAVVHGQLHSGIIRLVNVPAREQATLCSHILDKHVEDLLNGAIITADRQRIRVRTSGN
jgi:predicted nuclease of predicted toxin-antitoxin system